MKENSFVVGNSAGPVIIVDMSSPDGCSRDSAASCFHGVDLFFPDSYDWDKKGGILPVTGQVISHYRVLEKLGGGGMGIVNETETPRSGDSLP